MKSGKRTIVFDKGVYIASSGSVAGKKEAEGPLGNTFDEVIMDDLAGTDSWEKAESAFLKKAISKCMENANRKTDDIGVLLSGDLNAQIISSGFAARDLGVPFLGLYGACSTMVEGLLVASILVSSECTDNAVASASSHFCSAERQFRTPLELGTQRPPSAQWTATAAGACLLERKKSNVRIEGGTIGRVIDLKIKDVSHMGAAMAPAVYDTLIGHLQDTGESIDDFDRIVTGDLGIYGCEILCELIRKQTGRDYRDKVFDCGAHLYDASQDTHAGGSGCGCIASVFSGYLLDQMKRGEIRRMLVLGSGAMMSLTSSLQGESIPSVSYAVSVVRC